MKNDSRSTFPSRAGKFTVLVANFTFHRELTSKVVKTYLPSSLVVMMSWAGFWIDVTAVPARVTLAVTSVLTIVTQIAQAFDVTYVNALDLWLFACEFMVVGAVLEFVIAYTMAKTGPVISDAVGTTTQRSKENKPTCVTRTIDAMPK